MMRLINLMGHGKMANNQPSLKPFYLIMFTTWCLYLLPSHSHACSCVYSHSQEHFCSADFVATFSIQGDPKELVLDPSGFNTYQRYSVKVKKIFKGIDKTSVRKGFIYTGSKLSSCAPTFNKNVTYLITGRIINGKPFVTFCNFIAEWSNLTARQKKGFRRNYGRSCGCKVTDSESYGFYSGHLDTENESNNGSADGQYVVMNRRRFGNCFWETKLEIEFDCQGLYSSCSPVTSTTQKPAALLPNEAESTNDVNSLDAHFYKHEHKHHRRNRSKMGQRCQWDQNVDYRNCMKRKSDHKALLQLEREGQP